MSEKQVLMVFIGGKRSPGKGYTLGEVYLLRERYLLYPWFASAPEDSKVGASMPYHHLLPQPKTPDKEATPIYRHNLKIPADATKIVDLRFRGGKGAPGSYIIGEVYSLPLKYARFSWFTLVNEDDMPPIPEKNEEETVYVEGKPIKGEGRTDPEDEIDANAAFSEHILNSIPKGITVKFRDGTQPTPSITEDSVEASEEVTAPPLELKLDEERKKLLRKTKTQLTQMIREQGQEVDPSIPKAMLIDMVVNFNSKKK